MTKFTKLTKIGEEREKRFKKAVNAVKSLETLIKEKFPEHKKLIDYIKGGLNLVPTNPVTGAPSYLQFGIDIKDYERKNGRYNNKKNGKIGLNRYIANTDIDNFGLFNKIYGDKVGDSVLEGVVNMLLECLRKEDIFAKGYHPHGEEKLVVLYARNDEDAIKVMERYRKYVEENSEARLGYKVTETIGLTRQERDESVEDAERRAGLIMQYAKRLGKNMVLFMTKKEFEERKEEIMEVLKSVRVG